MIGAEQGKVERTLRPLAKRRKVVKLKEKDLNNY